MSADGANALDVHRARSGRVASPGHGRAERLDLRRLPRLPACSVSQLLPLLLRRTDDLRLHLDAAAQEQLGRPRHTGSARRSHLSRYEPPRTQQHIPGNT